MRKPIGIDVNGWHDFGCRDWDVDDWHERLSVPVIVDGGFGSVVVEHEGFVVGGPQAILSPIGRGNGWGRIGAKDKRRRLTGQWASFLDGAPSDNFAGDIQAAADAVSMQADQIYICIPDRVEMNEAHQQALLNALAGQHRPRATLLWRPVALLLGLLDSGALPGATEGLRVACLIHCHDGLEIQHLILRRLPDAPGWLAPERAGHGTLCCPDLGLARLLDHASDAVMSANPELADRPTETPNLPWDLLFLDGSLPTEHVVRRDNGNWSIVCAPQDYRLPSASLDIRTSTIDADLIVLLSPLAHRHRKLLRDQFVEGQNGAKLLLADPAMAARGALFASRRIERNIPHYLDRLDQISLVVSRGNEPAFEHLIPENATVPGNREYVSAPITSMKWPAGMTEANFYVRKGAREIRHWRTQQIKAPQRAERLEVRLRQMPAQGWAKLSITSPDWDELRRSPIQLDWETLQVDPRSEAEILATLERPRPIIPLRIRYAAHVSLWDGSARGRPGVLAALMTLKGGTSPDLEPLADAIRASLQVPPAGMGVGPFETVYPVGTDGDLPTEIGEADRQKFHDAIEHIAKSFLRTLRGEGPQLANNHALLCLSWVFARCPENVQHEMIAALDAMISGGEHALLVPRASPRVLVHGLGRVVTDPEMLRLLIPKFYSDIKRPNFIAALSSILSRPQETPRLLSDGDVQMIAEGALDVFRQLRGEGKFGTNFKYTLMVVAGLLRVRERDPWALLVGHSDLAGLWVDELSGAQAQIQSMPEAIANEAKKLQIIGELIRLLSGAGGRPDILTIMDTMPDA